MVDARDLKQLSTQTETPGVNGAKVGEPVHAQGDCNRKLSPAADSAIPKVVLVVKTLQSPQVQVAEPCVLGVDAHRPVPITIGAVLAATNLESSEVHVFPAESDLQDRAGWPACCHCASAGGAQSAG